MKKSLRIFALMMAALTALSVMSVTMATMPKNYIGIAEADGNSFMYAKPDKSSGYIYIDVNKPFVTNGTEMWLFDISDNYEWCYVGFSQYTGWMQADDLKIELRAGIVLKNATVDKNGKVVVNSNALSNQPQYATGVVTASNVNFRQGPGKSYAKVSGCPTLPKNAQVTILEDSARNNGWYKLQYGSYVGYMSADYVRVTASAGAGSGTIYGSTGYGSYTVSNPSNPTWPGTQGSSGGSYSWIGGGSNSQGSTAPSNTSSSSAFSGLVHSSGVTTPTTPGYDWVGGGSGSTSFGGSSSSTTQSGGGLFGSGSSTGSNSSNNTVTTVTGVTTGNINFRTKPDAKSAKVSGCNKVPKGSTVTILETLSGWYKVQYNGYTGYLTADYVKLASGSSSGVNTPSSNGLTPTNTSASAQAKYANYTGTSSDIWGSMAVAGTNIKDNIYCNAINSKGQFYYNAYSSSKNYLYALSYLGDPISVIYGHNMRKSAKKQTTNLGLHELHHVQNAWLGKDKCEYCKRSCSGAKTDTFNINYNGASTWKLVGFFELSNKTMKSASDRKKIQNFASWNSRLTGSDLQNWLNVMMSYCNSKYYGATLGTISSSNKVMVIITCADSSGSKNQSMYMILKAV